MDLDLRGQALRSMDRGLRLWLGSGKHKNREKRREEQTESERDGEETTKHSEARSPGPYSFFTWPTALPVRGPGSSLKVNKTRHYISIFFPHHG